MAFIDQMIKRNKEISLQLLIKTIRNCFRYNKYNMDTECRICRIGVEQTQRWKQK